MKLKLKRMNINADYMVCLINENDAQKFDLRQSDRIKISKGNNSVTAIIDVAKSTQIVHQGTIVLLNEAFEKLDLTENSEVDISPVGKPASLHFIKKKLHGKRLSDQEIYDIVKDIVDGNYSDIEITYFVSACYIHELSMQETVSLTNAILNTGDILKLIKYPIVDKHCVGGVAGNRTTMIIVPILASLGYTMPKTSSRSITSPAGTADTVEVLCPVSFDIEGIKKIVKKTNACIVWGGAVNMAPADDRIIKVEHPVSLDPTGQLLASIMAKKKSVSATHLLVDIPYGKGAKLEDYKKANILKKKFEKIAKLLSVKIKVMITDGSQPIGNGIGPVLEARDVLWVFERDKRAPIDLEQKGIEMAARLIELTKKASYVEALKISRELIQNGTAGKKFREIIKAQGGSIVESKQLTLAKLKKDILAPKGGIITHLDNKKISRIARIAGAPNNKSAGVYIYHHVGEHVEKGDLIMTVYAQTKDKLDYAVDFYEKFKGIDIN